MGQQMKVSEQGVLFNSMSGMIALEYVDDATFPTLFGIYRVVITGAGTTNIVVARNIEVVDAWCVKTALGGVADTVTVQNAGNAITDAMDLNVGDAAIVRATQVDDGAYQIAAGGQLRVVAAEASDVNCICYIRVAFYT